MNVYSGWIESYTHGDEIVSRKYSLTTYRSFAMVEIVEHSDAMPYDEPPERILHMSMNRRELKALREALDRAIADMA